MPKHPTRHTFSSHIFSITLVAHGASRVVSQKCGGNSEQNNQILGTKALNLRGHWGRSRNLRTRGTFGAGPGPIQDTLDKRRPATFCSLLSGIWRAGNGAACTGRTVWARWSHELSSPSLHSRLIVFNLRDTVEPSCPGTLDHQD